MCADRHGEDFVQVNVSADEDAVSSSSHRLASNLSPQIKGDESSDAHDTSDNQIQNRLTFDEVTNQHDEDEDEFDSDFEDETIVERLIGLTEMFPDWFRDAVCSAVSTSLGAIKNTYSFSRGAAWFLASTATVCLLPVMLEVERAQMEEQEASEHRSMMLGPGGVGGTPGVAGFQTNMPILNPVSAN